MSKNRRATMRDVAERAGVSVATVSRVINNKEGLVSPYTRRAVQQAIDELQYQLKTAPAEKDTRAEQIGLILPDITNPYFPCLIEGITKAARVYDVEVVLGNASESWEFEKYLFAQFLDNDIDGIIYIPFAEEINPLVQESVEDGFPLVFLDRETSLENISSVTSDNEEGAYQAVTYLLSLGHREVLFISGPPHLSTSKTRQSGYLRGLAEFGIPARKELIIYGDTKQESAYHKTLELTQGGQIPFTAIFASNDLMAFGAWKALERNGYRVPDDVSLIGYDDIPFASHVSLTTIAQPAYEIGRNSLILLMDLINGRRKPPQHIVLRDSLVIRRSCKKL